MVSPGDTVPTKRKRAGRTAADSGEALGLMDQILHRRDEVSEDETLAEHRDRPTRESRLWVRGTGHLPADRRLTARLRRMRRGECGVRHEDLPRPADLDQVVAVGPIAMQEDDELLGRAGARLEPWTVELCGHSVTPI